MQHSRALVLKMIALLTAAGAIRTGGVPAGPAVAVPAGRGLFISGTTAAEVTALPHYVAAVR